MTFLAASVNGRSSACEAERATGEPVNGPRNDGGVVRAVVRQPQGCRKRLTKKALPSRRKIGQSGSVSLCPEGMVIRMKVTDNNQKRAGRQTVRHWVQGATCALVLSTALLSCVACTGGDMMSDETKGDTTAGTTAGTTTPGTTLPGADSGTAGGTTGGSDTTAGTGTSSGGSDSGSPLDPDAGTVNPDGAPGDPPADTSNGTRFGTFRPGSRIMSGRGK